ncbi:MAG: ArsA family ATPase [Thermoleophilia bacterium]|nr:ArsA family ATPase [Thermoleophilia bacterium]
MVALRRPRARSAEFPLGLSPRTIFVTGKGGVGKTTVAAALALAWRDAGVRTLLVELEGQASAAACISTKTISYQPQALRPNLHAMRIDRDSALREYAHIRLKVKMLSDRLVGNPIMSQFAEAAPGLPELLVLGKLWALAKLVDGRGRPRFEAIVVDAPATGHGLGLLGMAGVVARMFPVGPISAEARQVDAFIRDAERVGAVLVALPEEMPVNETFDLADQPKQQGVDVSTVLLNGLLPARFTDDDIEHLEGLRQSRLDAALDAALATASYEHERRTSQLEEWSRLTTRFGDIATLPWIYTTELSRRDIEGFARWLTASGQTRLVREMADLGAVTP